MCVCLCVCVGGETLRESISCSLDVMRRIAAKKCTLRFVCGIEERDIGSGGRWGEGGVLLNFLRRAVVR